MNRAKISLSKQEMQLVTNGRWILTKNHIIQKVQSLLGGLQEKMIAHLKSQAIHLPAEVFTVHPKISKGENYKGLPYLVLDCPRCFKGENIFAIRTMFWWGNFFSITLHLSGHYKRDFEKKIINSVDTLKKENFFIAHNKDQWEHHFEKSNYTLIRKMPSARFRQIMRKNSFIKLATKIPLKKWNKANIILLDQFEKMTGILVD